MRLSLTETIEELIASNNVEELNQLLRTHNLVVRDGHIENQRSDAEEFWDKRQLVKKINLNS